MSRFDIRTPFGLSGRGWQGLRGWTGKPFHPPLTDVPITAYLFGAGFDLFSLVLHGEDAGLARQLFGAATWLFLGGGAISLLTALTGWADWRRGSSPGTPTRRTINTHATIMLTVTVLVILDLVLRCTLWNDAAFTPSGLTALSLLAAVLVLLDATCGGSVVYDHGFNVDGVDLERPTEQAAEPAPVPAVDQPPPPAGQRRSPPARVRSGRGPWGRG